MTAIANLPDLRPSLLLDFANSGRVDPRIQCTRASAATCFGPDGKMRTMAADVPRIDYDPVTGKCLGLLSESSSTNLLTNSISLSGYAQGSNGSYTDGRTSIDGVTPSKRVTANAAGQVSVSKSSIPVTPGPYTLSIYFCADVKPTSGVILRAEELQADGSKVARSLSITHPSVIADGKWRRYELTVTHASAGAVTIYFAVDTTPGSSIDICGGQYEAGALPTSYIPTEASAVTRAGESLYMEGSTFSSWYRQDEGSFVIENEIANLAASGVTVMPRFSDAGSSIYALSIRYGQAISGVDFFVSNNATQVDSNSFSVQVKTPMKIAAAYKSNDFAFVKDGSTVRTYVSGSVPTITRFELAAGQTGTIRRFAYYPKRISNDQLKRLTA